MVRKALKSARARGQVDLQELHILGSSSWVPGAHLEDTASAKQNSFGAEVRLLVKVDLLPIGRQQPRTVDLR